MSESNKKIDKKDIAIMVLIILITASFITNFELSITHSGLDLPQSKLKYCVVGFDTNPYNLDPIDTVDSKSINVQQQVVEGLVAYDLSKHPNYSLKPMLAEEWHWYNAKKISFKIKENVFFHDGTKLDAPAVKWNFERLRWFCNATGTLPYNITSWQALNSFLYFLPNGTFLFNRFEVSGDYNFTIYLNSPFVPLLDLLTHVSTSILSPTSTPKYSYLNLTTDILVGTGPFNFIHFKCDREVRYERWERYWATGPFFDVLIFRIIENQTALMTAALAGQFDYVTGVERKYLNKFKTEPYFNVEYVGEDLSYWYLELYAGPDDPALGNPWDYQVLNRTWRKALALTVNYSHIIEKIYAGEVVKGVPVVPRAMPSHNTSVMLPADWQKINGYEKAIKWARELIQSMGFGYDDPGITNPWDTDYPGKDELKWTNATFRELIVFSYPIWLTNEYLHQLLTFNWGLIGVKTDKIRRAEYIEYKPWDIDVEYVDWTPPYLDAFIMIDPLFNNDSGFCFSQLNDPVLLDKLKDAREESDPVTRQNIYKWIQSYIFEVNRTPTYASFTHIPLVAYKVSQVHKTELTGIQYNVLKILDCYKWYLEFSS